MGLIAFFLAFAMRPKRIDSDLATTSYECGIAPRTDSKIRFNVRYIVFALIFVAFDVEAVFLYPWAVKVKELGTYAIVEVTLFIAILLVGYFYAWGRGLLKWD
ncbi:MAG: NADH-quinone oxidoreductase subunit A [Caldisericales bacterium]|nr:NADH-quinone oxidoreductase subunit A [Caldisericales bacterium]